MNQKMNLILKKAKVPMNPIPTTNKKLSLNSEISSDLSSQYPTKLTNYKVNPKNEYLTSHDQKK